MEKHNKLIIAVLILGLLILGKFYKDLRSENEELSSLVDDYEYSLDEANDNIEDANSTIEDAGAYAWESYEEMGEALENMSTVDTVYHP